jgi:YspA, cpYpsA-related SLOG family
MRVLITGSRTWTDQKAVWASLDYVHGQFLEAHPMDAEELVVVHGACPKGTDLHAAEWVARRLQAGARVAEERHEANWSRGRDAGFLRNQEMVDLGADVCLTFIDRCRSPKCTTEPHGTHGSVRCATAAAAGGIPVRHIRPPQSAPFSPSEGWPSAGAGQALRRGC